jgi:beta-glucosidase-like glycosyl hydrolase
MKETELVPFAAAIAAGVATIMTAHILLPKIDAEHPASLSRTMLTDNLRTRMKFGGLILADDLGMGAVANRYPPAEAAVATFAAGTDIAMLCHDTSLIAPAIKTTAEALESGKLSSEEWKSAGTRINRVLAGLKWPKKTSLDVVGCAEHQALSAKLREKIARKH